MVRVDRESYEEVVYYAAYGDYVPFAKVYPAPTEDTLVTEIKAEGTNGDRMTAAAQSPAQATWLCICRFGWCFRWCLGRLGRFGWCV